MPTVDSPLHVKGKPIGIEEKEGVEGDNDGEEVGGLGEDNGNVDADVEVMSGQAPVEPHRSG